ncbi:MAG: ligand-binding sensor domain-containing protein, partial [Candidatus Latescibacterota bacterium]
MKRKSIFILLCLLFASETGLAAERWEYHLPWYGVRDFAFQGEYIWGAGIYSIVRWDRETGRYIQYSQRDCGVEGIPWRIAADTRGQVWVGYLSGGKASRFDGARWTVFDQSNSGIPESGIQSLLADRAGNVWFGTSGEGVIRFDGSGWFHHAPGDTVQLSEAPLSAQIIDMAEDPDGSVWFAGDRGLSRFDGASWRTWTMRDGLPGDRVTGVDSAPDGVIWCIAGGALASFDGVTFTTYPAPVQEDIHRAPYFYGSLTIAADGTIWTDEVELRLKTGTRISYAKGVWRFREGLWELIPLNPGGMDNYEIGKVCADTDGSVWFSTARDLICRNGETERTYRVDGPSSTLHAEIVPDRGGSFWFSGVSNLSSSGTNLAQYDGTSWETFDQYHALNITASRIELDERDRLWFFQQSDLVSFDGDSLRIELRKEERPTAGVADFIVADSRTVWFATSENGIYLWRNGAWEHFSIDSGLASNTVHTIALAPDGALWAGTSAGISRFDSRSWQNWILPSQITLIAFGKKGEVWCAGFSSLFRFDGTEWINPGNPAGPQSSGFVSLAVDA